MHSLVTVIFLKLSFVEVVDLKGFFFVIHFKLCAHFSPNISNIVETQEIWILLKETFLSRVSCQK